MSKEELLDKIDQFENEFGNDPEVIKLKEKLKEKYSKMMEEIFSEEELDSFEFQDACEDYYSSARENDPDDVTIFQVLWFTC